MNDEQIDDLKQFIRATISQTETSLERKIVTLGDKIVTLDDKVTSLDDKVTTLDNKVASLDDRVASLDDKLETLDRKVELLRQEMQDGFAGVGEVIETLQNHYDENNNNFDLRLTKFESKAA